MNFIIFHSEKNFIISGVCLSGVCHGTIHQGGVLEGFRYSDTPLGLKFPMYPYLIPSSGNIIGIPPMEL